ncbi:uncharacterized protein LOC119405611 [Rhipicephalus sanguineus]|uniref:uncharacterized protein LOC119405611 n=1 Tax=Rhipicephalus sanguineus TaxID=34632 RepID=UPI0020C1F9A6|nr:uncharacterized protein LOC119405611 [Rhipicephalus sanguineus]
MAEERNDGNRPPEFFNHGIAPSMRRALSQNASLDFFQDVPLDLSRRPRKSAEASNQPQVNPADDKPWVCYFCMVEFTRAADLDSRKDSNIIDGRHRCPVYAVVAGSGRTPDLFITWSKNKSYLYAKRHFSGFRLSRLETRLGHHDLTPQD